MSALFPRTRVGGMSLPRMIVGQDWMLGYSHISPAAEELIHSYHHSRESIAELLEAFLAHGVDALMGLFLGRQIILDAMKLAEDRTGKSRSRSSAPGHGIVSAASGPSSQRGRLIDSLTLRALQ